MPDQDIRRLLHDALRKQIRIHDGLTTDAVADAVTEVIAPVTDRLMAACEALQRAVDRGELRALARTTPRDEQGRWRPGEGAAPSTYVSTAIHCSFCDQPLGAGGCDTVGCPQVRTRFL